MASPSRIPVQNFFKVKTPSMTVTITAEDLLIPPLSGPIPVPGNLVTIDPNPRTSLESHRTADEASPKTDILPVSPSFSAESTEAVSHLGASERTARELSDMQESSAANLEASSPSSSLVRGSAASVTTPLFRSSSKHADALYGKFGAPPPIQPLQAEVAEERTAEGYALTNNKDIETKDFTYWDKLRRSGTRTEIRRWRTFFPEGEEDTAFYDRRVGVDVPVEAYSQGVYYTAEKEKLQAKEYKLPTRAYVAPAIWVRRAKGLRVCGSTCHCGCDPTPECVIKT